MLPGHKNTSSDRNATQVGPLMSIHGRPGPSQLLLIRGPTQYLLGDFFVAMTTYLSIHNVRFSLLKNRLLCEWIYFVKCGKQYHES